MNRIILVLDPEYGKNICDLVDAEGVRIWLLNTPTNYLWARKIWDEFGKSGEQEELKLNTFDRVDDEDDKSLIISVLELIEEHHNELSDGEDWSEIEVVGTPITDAIEKEAAEYGARRFEKTRSGFLMCRS